MQINFEGLAVDYGVISGGYAATPEDQALFDAEVKGKAPEVDESVAAAG